MYTSGSAKDTSNYFNKDLIPNDSPFHSAGLHEGFKVVVDEYTPEVRQLIVPKSMTTTYQCTLVYPGKEAWGAPPSFKTKKAWFPLGYKRDRIVCAKAEGHDTIFVKIKPADGAPGTIQIESCWMCLVAGCIDDCDIRGVMIGADGKIVWRPKLHQNDVAPSPTQDWELDLPLPSEIITSTSIPALDAETATPISPSRASKTPVPTPQAIRPSSVLAKKRKHHASSRDTPDLTSESETSSASDWYRQFLDLAARAPPQIVPQIQYDLAMSELRTARKVISDQAAELKASEVSHQDLTTQIDEIQARATAGEREIQLLKQTVEFYRTNIRDTLREVGNDKENDGLDQMNDEQLWSELVCPHE